MTESEYFESVARESKRTKSPAWIGMAVIVLICLGFLGLGITGIMVMREQAMRAEQAERQAMHAAMLAQEQAERQRQKAKEAADAVKP